MIPLLQHHEEAQLNAATIAPSIAAIDPDDASGVTEAEVRGLKGDVNTKLSYYVGNGNE